MLICASENQAVQFLQSPFFQTFSIPQTSNTSQYKWIRVLESTEPFQIILIDKASQTLDVLEYDNDSFTKIASYTCATGADNGKKYKSGDSRTPEGIYFITQSFSDNKITIFGKRAFHLDYPNHFDRSENRNGDGIYIHGTNKKLIPQSTNGCITMKNKDLDLLAQYLVEHKTPIIIVNDERELRKLSGGLSEIREDMILSLLEKEDIYQYDPQINSLLVVSYGTQKVVVGKLMFLDESYPYATTFFRGYLKKDETGSWYFDKRIFRGPLVKIEPTRKKIQLARTTSLIQPGVQKRPPVISDQTTNDQIISFIEKWRQAWQNKQLDNYIDCYAENFKQGRKNLKAWRKYKKSLNIKYGKISVKVDKIKIDLQKNGAKVLFHQVYKSDKFFADGYKQLVLTYSDEKGWQILRERWLN